MDPFVILREMWQEAVKRRRLLGLVLAISIVIGAFVAYRPGLPPESRQYTVWQASSDILVDTVDSQVVDAKGPDFLSLANRTTLLGNLIATDPLRASIADQAGIEAERLVVVPPANTSADIGGVALTPTPVTTPASREIPDSEATVLTVSSDGSLPILRVTAQAPDAETASSLTTSTMTQLQAHLKTVAANEQIPSARKLALRQLAAPTPAPETRGTPRLLGVLVAVLVALLGCGAIVTAPMVVRRWRNAEAVAGRADSARAGLDPELANAPFDRAADHGSTSDRAAAHGDAFARAAGNGQAFDRAGGEGEGRADRGRARAEVVEP